MNLQYPRRFLTKQAVSLTLLLSLVITNAFAVRPVSGTQSRASNAPTSSAIYTTDLTQLGRQGRLRVSLSFEKEVNRLVEVLGKGGARQPVIVDEKGESQDAIVDQLAVRIAKGDVPDSLKNRTVVKLMTKVLFSNAKTAKDVDAIVNSVVDQAVASKRQTILYVDELSNFVQAAGGNAKLIDALAKGQISLIGGSIKAARVDAARSDVHDRVSGKRHQPRGPFRRYQCNVGPKLEPERQNLKVRQLRELSRRQRFTGSPRNDAAGPLR